ncbi:MAG: nucleoside-diphosphate kinase, partial [Planctomycetota bacterium]
MAERTLIIIKPDAIQRHLMGAIIARFEQKGLKLAAAKFIRISEELA